jgi:hypothetical protein
VKTTERGGPRGDDGAKKGSGRQRHLVVDTTGLRLRVVGHPANRHDRDGAKLVLAGMADASPRIHQLSGPTRALPAKGRRGARQRWAGR